MVYTRINLSNIKENMANFTLQTRKSDTLAVQMNAGANSATLTNGSFGSPSSQQIITIDYDVASKAADFLCTISGTAITSMTLLNGADVIHAVGAKVGMCFVDEHYTKLTNAIDNLNSGWIDPEETWTYASATTITVPSGAASKYAVGDKIKLTQTTVKYFYITAVADTLLTVTGGSDYTLTNTAITDFYYSKAASPLGFPQWFNRTSNLYKSDGTTALSGNKLYDKFKINGREVVGHLRYMSIANPLGSEIHFDLPIAAVSYGYNHEIGQGYAYIGAGGGYTSRTYIADAALSKGVATTQSGTNGVEGTWGSSGNDFSSNYNYEI